MRAVLTNVRFSDPGWIYERKLDGVRCLGIKAGRHVRLFSRNHLSLNERFPDLVEALGRNRLRPSASTRSGKRSFRLR